MPAREWPEPSAQLAGEGRGGPGKEGVLICPGPAPFSALLHCPPGPQRGWHYRLRSLILSFLCARTSAWEGLTSSHRRIPQGEEEGSQMEIISQALEAALPYLLAPTGLCFPAAAPVSSPTFNALSPPGLCTCCLCCSCCLKFFF